MILENLKNVFNYFAENQVDLESHNIQYEGYLTVGEFENDIVYPRIQLNLPVNTNVSFNESTQYYTQSFLVSVLSQNLHNTNSTLNLTELENLNKIAQQFVQYLKDFDDFNRELNIDTNIGRLNLNSVTINSSSNRTEDVNNVVLIDCSVDLYLKKNRCIVEFREEPEETP